MRWSHYDYDYVRPRGDARRPHGPARRPHPYHAHRRYAAVPPRRPHAAYRWAFDGADPRGEQGGPPRAGGAFRYPYERRRTPSEGGPRGFLGRARRYKEPLIGLAVLGAAAPLALGAAGGGGSPAMEGATVQQASLAPPLLGHPVSKRSVEQEVGQRWAGATAQARSNLVRQAMSTYGISRNLAEQIYDTAVAHRLDPKLGYGLVKTESAFDKNAISNVGARGLTQLMPDTATWLRPGTTNAALHNDTALNLDLGFGYLRSMIDKYQGNTRLALLAYNRGPGTVDRVLRQGQNPDNGYADLVLSGFRDLS